VNPTRPPGPVPEPEPLGASELLPRHGRPPSLPRDDTAPGSPWVLFRRRFVRHKVAVASVFVLGGLCILCFGAPFFAPYARAHQDLSLGAVGPSWSHWFGTDDLGEDQLTRLLYAGQISLEIGLAVAALSTLIGTVIGAVAGFVGKATDQTLMRVTDLFLVLPALAVLAIALQRFGHDRLTIIWVLAALFWMYVARVVRAQVLSIREQEFVEAARASGASTTWIIVRHVLPNCVGLIVVNATLAVAAAIVAESSLSFLGFGVQLPATSWGRMVSDAEGTIGTSRAYLLYFPGLAILLTVLAVNFIGDGLRDAFDPHRDPR
jgi:peptide/nickel transport system permease protein